MTDQRIPTLLQLLQRATEKKEKPSLTSVRDLFSIPSDEVSWATINLCGQTRMVEATDLILAAVAAKRSTLSEEKITSIAAWSLAQFDASHVVDKIERRLANADPTTKLCFADYLGFIKNEKALHLLDRLIQQPETKISLWAALSLSKHGELAIPILRRNLFALTREDPIVFILDALGKIGTPAAASVASDFLATEKGVAFRDFDVATERFSKQNNL